MKDVKYMKDMKVGQQMALDKLKYARLLFLSGLLSIIAAAILSVLFQNALLVSLSVLVGLVLAMSGLIVALVQSTKSIARLKVVDDGKAPDASDYVKVVDIIAYFFFVK